MIGVALQAAPPVVGDLLSGFGQPMRIVAGCAPQRTLARAEAAALVHLFDLADEPLLGRPAGLSSTVQNSWNGSPGR